MSEDDGIDRRTLVRLLIVVTIGVPILVEATTFLGLVSHSLGDEGGDTSSPTPPQDATGVGDDLLAETPRDERVTTGPSVGPATAGSSC